MRRARIIAGLLLICGMATQANAETRNFNIPPGPLGGILVAFGKQASMTVGLNDQTLGDRHSPGVRGNLSPRRALRRLLAGTGASFVEIDGRTVKIVSIAKVVAPVVRQTPDALPRTSAETVLFPEIVVTASKQNILLRNYAGTVSVVDLDPGKLQRIAPLGTAALIARLPELASTSLGPGRNKIFVRGIADSSFNGSSPATVGQYLGDVRLTYNAPDPNLNLYDMSRVEILEGPQGTLYGTGALGGIIRLVPNGPDLRENSGSISTGGVSISHGGQGHDLTGMANLVLITDRAALRIVAFQVKEPGYIDDPSRGLTNMNRSKSKGGRAALEIRPGRDWTITVGGAQQNIMTQDGQYALRDLPPLTRHSTLAQPFDNDFGLAYVTARKLIGAAQLTTTTSLVRQDVDSIYDATESPDSSPLKFQEMLEIRLLNHETRLSSYSANSNWILGVNGIIARSRTTRLLGDPASPDPITGVQNINQEVALFGQYSHHLAPNLFATAGGRLSFAHSTGEVLDDEGEDVEDPTRNQGNASFTLGLGWHVRPKLLFYLHGQSAYRPGLLQIAPSGGPADTRRVDADSVRMVEAGLRSGGQGRDRFVVDANLAIARWTEIQSDLIDSVGLPYTTNIGDGRILTAQVQASWMVTPELLIDASIFLNGSKLTKAVAEFAAAEEKELPNIPHVGAHIAANYRHRLSSRAELVVTGSARYVGSSDLGIGPPLDVSQGNYLDTALGARLAWGRVGLSVDAANLTNVRGNRFSYGNPFSLDEKNQITPLVPRRIRVGFDVQF